MAARIFHQPTSLEEAVALHAETEGAKFLAGGATLVAMLNANLLDVPALISLRQVSELKGITRTPDGSVVIGAMTRHHDIATTTVFLDGQSVVAEAAGHIGHPAIRNMGTIGGSIAHADPAADLPTAITAADAVVSVVGPAGRREIPADDFFLDYLETALAPEEIVTAIRLPPASQGSVGVYEKFARVQGDFATVSVAAVVAMDGDICRALRLAVGSCGPRPVRLEEAERRLIGTRLAEDDILAAAALLTEACEPIDDMRGSGEYRLSLVPVLIGRAIRRAVRRGRVV